MTNEKTEDRSTSAPTMDSGIQCDQGVTCDALPVAVESAEPAAKLVNPGGVWCDDAVWTDGTVWGE